MNKTYNFLFIALTLSTVTLANGKKTDAYFRQATFDSKLAIIGKQPLEEEAARKTNCYHFTYDDLGRLSEVEYLKANKLNTDLFFGIASIRMEYANGFEKRSYFDMLSKPMADNIGVYAIRLKYDENMNTLSLFNYNKGGELIRDHANVAEYRWLLDKDGRRLKSMRFDNRGNRIVDAEGFYEIRTKYDDKGNLIELVNYGKNGDIKMNNSMVEIIHRKYDDNSNLIEESYYGTDNQLKEAKDRVAVIKWQYDAAGNLLEESYFGIDEQPRERRLNENSSYATVRWKYDQQGNLVKTMYLNKKQAVPLTSSN